METTAQDQKVEPKRDLLFASNKLSILPKVTLKNKIFADNLIVFVHTHKTGGTNIEYLVKALAFDQGFKQIRVFSQYKPGISHNAFIEGYIGGLKTIKDNSRKFDCSKNGVKFISGHMPLPDGNYFKAKVDYISLVREPLDRALSLANFLYQRNFLKEDDFEDYLFNKEIDNLQTRFLAGEKYMTGECTEDVLKEAKKNIREKFKLVAPTEEVEVVMSVISSHFGVENVAYARGQISKAKLITKENHDLCERILERNQYDSKLYEFVQVHWNSWKNDNIESITDNTNNQTEYLTISSSFYQDKQVHYMNFSQINESVVEEEVLVGVIQHYW